MLKYKNITVDEVREVFDYDEETGQLIWKIKPCKKVNIGDVAGSYNRGYKKTGYKFATYFIHRLVWAYVHGKFPSNDIDHIDGDPANNRISNLRAVSHQVNLKNSKLSKRNKSGITGVYWNKKTSKWEIAIGIKGKKSHLGCFGDFFEACCARKSAENKYGYHPNHGRRA
jgi:hypothetical protein